MMDRGNDAMLSAADRHYNADPTLRDEYGNPLCPHCEVNTIRDESEACFAKIEFRGWRYDGVCLDCAAGIFEEGLEEFTEGLSLFTNIFTDQHSHMPMAAE